jgi:hypothetical protein
LESESQWNFVFCPLESLYITQLHELTLCV